MHLHNMFMHMYAYMCIIHTCVSYTHIPYVVAEHRQDCNLRIREGERERGREGERDTGRERERERESEKSFFAEEALGPKP